MSVKDFEKTLPRKDFREVLGKSLLGLVPRTRSTGWGGLGIVVCYDNEGLEGEPVYLACEQASLGC